MSTAHSPDADAPGETLADLARRTAPLAAPRAAAVLSVVVDELVRHGTRGPLPDLVDASTVHVAESWEITSIERADDRRGVTPGAAVGRWYFLLLVGRAPLGRDDAFEPVVTRGSSQELRTLTARACADQPSQWPELEEWRDPLRRQAGPSTLPPPPAALRARRRRLVAVAVAAVLMAAAVAAVLLLAPRWWDAATERSSAASAATPRAAVSSAVGTDGGRSRAAAIDRS